MAITSTTDHEANLRAIVNWLETHSGLGAGKVIFLNQVAKRPAKPYIGILISSQGITFGYDETRQSFDIPTQAIQRQTAGPRQLVVQVEIYTDPVTTLADREAAQRLEELLNTLQTEAVRDDFRAAKLGVVRHSQIQRLDEQFNDRWERRAQADIFINYSGETFDDGGGASGDWIENVDLPTEYNENLILEEGPFGGQGLVWTQQTSGTIDDLYGITGQGDFLRIVSSGADDILRSTDKGASWSIDTSVVGWWQEVRCNSNGTCILGGSTGAGTFIRRSTDDGQTWVAVAGTIAQSVNALLYDENTQVWLAAANGGKIYRSTDDGQTWAEAGNTFTNALHGLATDNNGRIVIVGAGGHSGYSIDGGATWVNTSSGSNGWQDVAYDKVTGNYIAVGLSKKISTSSDGGVTWTPRANPAVNSNFLKGVAANDLGIIIAVGSYQGIIRSTDGGVTWALVSEGAIQAPSLQAVHHGTRRWHAVGEDGYIITAA